MIFPALTLAAALYRIVAIPTPTGVTSHAFAINDRGVVAGQMGPGAFTWDGTHLVRYRADAFYYLDGDYTSVAVSIDDHGFAVGRDASYRMLSMSGLEVATAVTFRHGTMRYLNRKMPSTFEADGVNDAGWIVGASAYRGFVRRPNGRYVEVEPLSTRPEYNGTRATAIDDENDIVGATTIPVPWALDGNDPNGPEGVSSLPVHAFLLHLVGNSQRMIDLGTIPGFLDSYATAIAEDGTVVGFSGSTADPKTVQIDGLSHAWMWYHGRMSDLAALSMRDSSAAFGVNDRGIVVGCDSSNAGYRWGNTSPDDTLATLTAVRWVDKRIQNLNTLVAPGSGWYLSCARAVSRNGTIVGEGLDRGIARAFMLVPRERRGAHAE